MTVSECPTCQAKAPITKTWTRSSDGSILRRRTCDRCGEGWTTAERLLGDTVNAKELAVNATMLAELLETLGIAIDRSR